jgi:hypothetical protein
MTTRRLEQQQLNKLLNTCWKWISVERITILQGVYTKSKSGDAEWITIRYKGCANGVSCMDRCDLDDLQARINFSLGSKITDYACRLSASRHPTSSEGLTQTRATQLE